MPAPDGNTNASHRKKMAREALRLQIDGEKCLDTLFAISDELGAGDLNAIGIQAMKAKADIQFGLLRKILPDLKATEHSGPDGGDIPLSGKLKIVDSRKPGA